MGGTLEVFGSVEVSRGIQMGKAVALIIAVVALSVVLIFGVFQGQFAILVVCAPLWFCIGLLRGAVRTGEMRSALFRIEVLDGWLRILMPGMRLYDGRYVDQFYQTPCTAIEAAEFDSADVFHLRSRQLESYALDNGAILDHRSHEFTEISFKVDGDAQRALTSFLKEAGI